jgi:tRNA nucleotidyltransferase (CCA-adding enzyme)
MRFFLVGGCVRDSLLGIKSKDIDIAVEALSWDAFRDEIRARHSTIFVEEEDFLRIKALGTEEGLKGALDYTMCRTDGFYSDGRHPDSVTISDINGDLSRRDFTVNAMARNIETGELIDPFGGQEDLKSKELHCVGKAYDRMHEDGLRWFRAFRFNVMKGFTFDNELWNVMHEMMCYPDMWFKNTSTERVREELRRCFFHSTPDTMRVMSGFFETEMLEFLQSRGIWFNPTTKEKIGNGE